MPWFLRWSGLAKRTGAQTDVEVGYRPTAAGRGCVRLSGGG